jgi:hypothetical protein
MATTYDLRRERAISATPSDRVDTHEPAIQVAAHVFLWIGVPALFWGGLAAWLLF